MWQHTLGLFHREKPHLLNQIHRIAIKSRGSSAAAKSCNPHVSSPTQMSAVTPTPVAVGSVFDYFSKPVANPSIQEAMDLAADVSQSHSSDETANATATTQDQERIDTKSQTNDQVLHTGADNSTLSCTNDDLLSLAASLFEQKEDDL